MSTPATSTASTTNVVRPEFKPRGGEPRGAPAERIARLADTLGRDGRKLRAIEVLLTVRNAQVLALDVPSCAKLASIASDLDRILQRVQRVAYRQMDQNLIGAARKVEDEMARAVDLLAEQAATLAQVAGVDSDVLLDPTVRRRLRDLKGAQAGGEGDAGAEASESTVGEPAATERPRKRKGTTE